MGFTAAGNPQTILLALTEEALPVHGEGLLRLRAERWPGYKQAKFTKHIERR